MQKETLNNNLIKNKNLFSQTYSYEDLSEGLIQQPHQNINQPSNSQKINKKLKLIKIILILIFSSSFLTYRFIHTFTSPKQCIFDAYQQFTFQLNRKLYSGWDNIVLGIGQVIMDGWIVSSLLFWYFIALIIQGDQNTEFQISFCHSEFLCNSIDIFDCQQEIEAFPFPKFIVWHNPGFYSLTVPYDHTRDFFYSGHTGSLIIIMLQFSQFTVKKPHYPVGYIWIFTFVCLVYMMNMLIVTRIHYTVDVVGGIVFSTFFYWFTSYYVYWFDRLANLPYLIFVKPVSKFYYKIRRRKQTNNLNEGKIINSTISLMNDKSNSLSVRDQFDERQNQ